MRDLKRLVDPAGTLNPGVGAHRRRPRPGCSDLKTTAPVEEEVDRCVECGFCEPVCPSRSLTMTPRQRIVARRELALAEERGDTALVEDLRRDYEYDGKQTCAVDGMCATACPVLINTGDLVRRLRAADESAPASRAWSFAAGHWSGATRAASAALTTADHLPDRVPVALSHAGRSVLGADQVPLYDPGLSRGGGRRPQIDAVPAQSGPVRRVRGHDVRGRRDRVRCCDCASGPGSGCARRGLSTGCAAGRRGSPRVTATGYDRMSERVRDALGDRHRGWPAARGRRRELLHRGPAADAGRLRAGGLDATEFVADRVLPSLTVTSPVPAVVVHPTCSSTAAGSTDALLRLARAVTDEVVVPGSWGCCAFAGDRGLLHPELTAAATGPEAAEVAGLAPPPGTAYVSSNRTCEIGMARATGQDYRHVLEVLDAATR